jgi:glutaredoxin
VKSYLTVRAIEFDSIDISSDPAGFDRLVSLGARTTPVLAIGDKWVGGAAFDRIKEFLRTEGASGVATADKAVAGVAVGNVFATGEPAIVLDESALMTRLDALLTKAIVYIAKVPQPMLTEPLPVRGEEGRTVRGLAFHIGQVAYDPLRAADGTVILKSMHEYDPPGWLHTAADLAEEAALARERLRKWWDRAEQPVSIPQVEYYQGPYTFHGLLERCTWHVATHVRQLAWLLVESGIDTEAGLTDDDVHGLPMPVGVWK